MNRRRGGARLLHASLLLALIAAAFVTPRAWAQSDRVRPPPPEWSGPETTRELVQDLQSDEAARRLFAARELKRQAKAARRRAGWTLGDDLLREAAAVELSDLRADVLPAAHYAVTHHERHRRIVVALLRALGDPRSIPPLAEALPLETRMGVRRKIERAIADLERTTDQGEP